MNNTNHRHCHNCGTAVYDDQANCKRCLTFIPAYPCADGVAWEKREANMKLPAGSCKMVGIGDLTAPPFDGEKKDGIQKMDTRLKPNTTYYCRKCQKEIKHLEWYVVVGDGKMHPGCYSHALSEKNKLQKPPDAGWLDPLPQPKNRAEAFRCLNTWMDNMCPSAEDIQRRRKSIDAEFPQDKAPDAGDEATTMGFMAKTGGGTWSGAMQSVIEQKEQENVKLRARVAELETLVELKHGMSLDHMNRADAAIKERDQLKAELAAEREKQGRADKWFNEVCRRLCAAAGVDWDNLSQEEPSIDDMEEYIRKEISDMTERAEKAEKINKSYHRSEFNYVTIIRKACDLLKRNNKTASEVDIFITRCMGI